MPIFQKINSPTQRDALILRRDIKRPAKDANFIVHTPFRFSYWLEDNVTGARRLCRFTVPPGFHTDLASVPRGARWLVSKTDLIEASVIHDYLYAGGPNDRPVVSRLEADSVYLAFAKAAGDSFIRRNAAWLAIRLFGRIAYST